MLYLGIGLLIVSIILGAALYFFSKKWKEKTIFQIQVIFKGVVYLTVIVLSLYSMHNMIWSSSKEISKKLKQNTVNTIKEKK